MNTFAVMYAHVSGLRVNTFWLVYDQLPTSDFCSLLGGQFLKVIEIKPIHIPATSAASPKERLLVSAAR